MSGWIKRFLNWTVAEADRRAFRVNEIERELTLLTNLTVEMNHVLTTTDDGCPRELTDAGKESLAVLNRAMKAYEEQLRDEADRL